MIQRFQYNPENANICDVKWHLLWILPLLLLVAILGIGGFFLVYWLTGDDGQAFIEQRTADALHVKAEFGPLRWQWLGLSSPHFHATGSAKSNLKEMKATELRARLNPAALLQGVWAVEEISMERMTLYLGAAGQGEPTENAAISPTPPLPKWFPSQLAINVIRSGQADVMLSFPEGREIDIIGTSLEDRPGGSGNRIEARGGVVRSSFLQDMELKKLRCLTSKSGVELQEASINVSGGGNLLLTGSFPDEKMENQLIGRWNLVPISFLLPLLKDKVVGTIEGEATVRWANGAPPSLEGTVMAHDVTISSIPLLEELAIMTGIEQFRHLPIQEFSASFTRQEQKTTWSAIVMESKGILKVTGDAVTMNDGALKGTFLVGVSLGKLGMIPGLAEAAGLQQRDGYLCTTVHLGGTLSFPTNDLTPRLATMIAGQASGSLRQGVQQGMQFFNSVLGTVDPTATSTRATGTPSATNDHPKTIQDSAGAALDVLGGLIK